jgi:hypothetical protein
MVLKKFIFFIGISIFLVVNYGIYKMSTFSIFDNEIKMLKEIKVANKNYNLKIYYVPSNASSQSYIQIRKSTNEIEETIESYERFNFLNNYKFSITDSLSLFISDTSSVNVEIKEVKIKLPK